MKAMPRTRVSLNFLKFIIYPLTMIALCQERSSNLIEILVGYRYASAESGC